MFILFKWKRMFKSNMSFEFLMILSKKWTFWSHKMLKIQKRKKCQKYWKFLIVLQPVMQFISNFMKKCGNNTFLNLQTNRHIEFFKQKLIWKNRGGEEGVNPSSKQNKLNESFYWPVDQWKFVRSFCLLGSTLMS